MRLGLQEDAKAFPHIARLVTAMMHIGGAFTTDQISAAYYAGEDGWQPISATTLQYLSGRDRRKPAILRKECRQDSYTLTPAGEDVYNRYKDAEGFQQMAEVAVLAAKSAGKTDTDAVDRAIEDISRILEEFDIDTRAYIISQV